MVSSSIKKISATVNTLQKKVGDSCLPDRYTSKTGNEMAGTLLL